MSYVIEVLIAIVLFWTIKKGNYQIMATLTAIETQIAANSTALTGYVNDVNSVITKLQAGETIPDADLAALQAQGTTISSADTALQAILNPPASTGTTAPPTDPTGQTGQ